MNTEQTTIVPEPTAKRPGHRGHLTAYVHGVGQFSTVAGWTLWNPATERYESRVSIVETAQHDSIVKARRWLRRKLPQAKIVGMRGEWLPKIQA